MTITWQKHDYCGPSENTEIDEAVKGYFWSLDGFIKDMAFCIRKHHDSTLPCLEKFWG